MSLVIVELKGVFLWDDLRKEQWSQSGLMIQHHSDHDT